MTDPPAGEDPPPDAVLEIGGIAAPDPPTAASSAGDSILAKPTEESTDDAQAVENDVPSTKQSQQPQVPQDTTMPIEETSSQRGAGESVSALSASNITRNSGSAVNEISGHTETSSASAAAGPPTNIIQQQPSQETGSGSLIKLDDDSRSDRMSERMSDVSDFHVENGNSGNLLNMDSGSSGTSMGSQGSYAYQVPALSSKEDSVSNRAVASYSDHKTNLMQPALAHPPMNGEEIDLAKGNVKLPHRTEGLMMMNSPPMSTHSSEMHSAVKSPTGLDRAGSEMEHSDLDDILGPTGEPMKSDLDEILGPNGDTSGLGKQSDLDDTLGPYEADSKAPTVESSIKAEPTTVPSAESMTNNYASHLTSQLDATVKRGSSTRLSSMDNVGAGTMAIGTVASSFTEYPDPVDPSPAITPAGSEPGTPSDKGTPSLSRKAIDDIGKMLANRSMGDQFSSPTNHTSASILPEPSVHDGASTAYGTAMDYSGHSRTMGASPQVMTVPSSTTSRGANSQQEFFPRKAESVDSVEPASTFESRPSTWAAPTRSDPTLGGYDSGARTLSPDNGSSFWASTRGDTMSPGASSRGENTLSPGGSEALSPSTQGESTQGERTFSPSTRASPSMRSASSQDDTTYASSKANTFSPRDDSTRGDSVMTSPAESSHTGTLSPGMSSHSHGGTFSDTAHTRDRQYSSVYSSTEHTRGGEYTDASDSHSQGDQFSPTTAEYSHGSHTQFSFDTGVGPSEHPTETAAAKINATATDASVPMDEAATDRSATDNGGRMWEAAEIEAKNSMDRPLSPKAQKFAETIMARTRSRADPDAVSTVNGDAMDTPTRSMVKLTTDEDVGMIERTAFARKRVRVVQLLGAGLLAFLVSFLGGFWLQSSCYFVSTTIAAGENQAEFTQRFGLWKYTPADSVFEGYAYCSPYDDDVSEEAPWVARFTSNLALIGGAFSLLVLWIYLVFGRCNHLLWKGAVVSAGLSGVLQLITLSIFAGPICSNGCSLGPGGLVSILAGCIYLFLAYEMYYNAPLATVTDGLLSSTPSGEDTPRNLVASLEMKDIGRGAKSFVRRLTIGEDNPYPTLNQAQRDNGSPMGEQMLDRDLSKTGSYHPPAVFV